MTSCGMRLDAVPGAVGEMRDSSALVGDPEALRERMGRDGYLFLPGLLDRDRVLAARSRLTAELAARGHIDPDRPDEAVLRPGSGFDPVAFGERPYPVDENPDLRSVLDEGALPHFHREFLGCSVRRFERNLLRARAGDQWSATYPHCDSVFMGRGTPRVYTSWVPLGDLTRDMGGLMVLEKSHHVERIRHEYSERDVDEYCANHPDAAEWLAGTKSWDGKLSDDPVAVQRSWGGRWLGAEFRAGDVVVFSIHTVHGSTDNLSDRVRLSVDARYQSAAEPADERWVGSGAAERSRGSLRGRIC
ncbi:phytanoyl-CoA dioxygenase family protein [Streptomyces sp. NPDC033754]|uniref:phytanoyl-CoA dioxygenase family protein n=1 Tax=unclassified Streptomyces TaxID=2593676 RepID=UPI0033DE36F5